MASETDLSQLQRPTQVRWLIFGLACAASWMLYVHRYAWQVAKPEVQKEYGLTDGEMGWLDFAFQPTYGLFQVPGGLVGDLWGTHLILAGSIFLWSLTVAALAWAWGIGGFVAVRAAFGATQAPAYPVLTKVTRNWFPLRLRTSLQGIVIAMGRLGGACASLIVATLLIGHFHLTWREAAVVLAVPGVLLAVGFWICFRDNPAEHPWVNEAERALIAEGEAPAAKGRFQLNLEGLNGLHAGLLLTASLLSTFADQFYVFWVVPYLKDSGLSYQQVGLYAVLPTLGGALGTPVGGFLNDYFLARFSNPRLVRSAIAVFGKGTAALLTFLIVFIDEPQFGAMMLFAVKLVGDWSLATQWGATTDMGGRAAGTLFGAVNTAGTVGAGIASVAMGYTKQFGGWDGLFALVAGVYLLTAICWAFIDCTRRLVRDEPAAPASESIRAPG